MLLDGRGGAVELAGDRALVHDEDAVRERAELVEVLADQEHRDAGAAASRRYPWTVSIAADVEPPRRLRGDEHARLALELAPEHELLEVAAGEVAHRRVRPGAFTS